MTLVATVHRDAAAGTDTWGQVNAPSYALLGEFPCYVWSRQRRESVTDQRTAVIEDLRAMFAIGAGVRNGDRIVNLADRLGNAVMSGAFEIGPVQWKVDHIEAALERVT